MPPDHRFRTVVVHNAAAADVFEETIPGEVGGEKDFQTPKLLGPEDIEVLCGVEGRHRTLALEGKYPIDSFESLPVE
jgi:hypothetical protein